MLLEHLAVWHPHNRYKRKQEVTKMYKTGSKSKFFYKMKIIICILLKLLHDNRVHGDTWMRNRDEIKEMRILKHATELTRHRRKVVIMILLTFLALCWLQTPMYGEERRKAARLRRVGPHSFVLKTEFTFQSCQYQGHRGHPFRHVQGNPVLEYVNPNHRPHLRQK